MSCFVTGDWTGGRSYPALIVGTWNGWVVPIVDRATAELIVADAMRARPADDTDSDVLSWDGDTIVRHRPAYAHEDGYTDERIGPEPDGSYCVSFDWCWTQA